MQQYDPNSKKWRLVLIISLSLNLIVLGAVGGAMFRQDDFKKSSMNMNNRSMESIYIRALDNENRRALGKKMREQSKKQRGMPLAEMQPEQFVTVLEILRSPQLDVEKLGSVLAQHAQFARTRLMQAQEIMVDHLATLTMQERLEYADRIEKILKRTEKRRANDSAP